MRLSLDEEKRLNSLSLEEKKKEYDNIKLEIINSPASHQLIISGPGTGKTRAFKAKIEKWNNDGIENDKILITSFINYIVDDLYNSLPKDCKIYTLHKLAKIIIHRYLGLGLNFTSPLNNNFNIAWECDEINICKDLITLDKLNINVKALELSLKTYFRTLSDKPAILNSYLKLVSFYNVITFEDSIVRAIKALQKSSSASFKKIIVDEYQDFNSSEQRLVKILFDKSEGGIIAGDDDQSIYSAKKADPSGLLTLVENNSWEKRTLPFCGRCRSQHVIESAIEICRKQENNSRKDKSLLPLESNNKKIKIINLKSSTSNAKNKNKHFFSEAEYIAKYIDKDKLSKWDKDYPAYLILGRTAPHLEKIAKGVEERLNFKVGIKEKSMYDDAEVQTLFSYIQLLKDTKSNIAYRRLIGLNENVSSQEIFLKALSKNGFNGLDDTFIKKINTKLKTIKNISKQKGSTEKLLWKFVKELKLNKNNPEMKRYINSLKDIAFAKIIGETEDLMIVEQERKRKELLSSPVQFLTIWGSKGLKAETVFILGLEEGYFPISNKNVEDEEIRLMYVAMTRSVEELILLNCLTRYDGVHSLLKGNNGPMTKSIFLTWIRTNNADEVTFGKQDLLKI
ncbi:MAG: hypothetical protein CO135_01730 [Candidatus Levybacteria bacterium CG_4_9_14_3_um_filter_35_16]|nr:MAG: hypothetical protein COW87_04165 [Candidatus Levybacteria bacterium CG22_combo_CG10-13_8_21_14_all_35_11]PJA91366.1 MAG: hypothetical protein CO135_01730 [Candidatus Levybacteria bacterium CG_4_9_14_3_um_filter_35_16]PJC54805.1 MAG: hypothetical protein CO028_00645 [Candidatus Levybacteria bacterium CG_4_9_14_0_2_um_filter_35_21]